MSHAVYVTNRQRGDEEVLDGKKVPNKMLGRSSAEAAQNDERDLEKNKKAGEAESRKY